MKSKEFISHTIISNIITTLIPSHEFCVIYYLIQLILAFELDVSYNFSYNSDIP